MLGKGLAYGWLAARRRIGEMVLPVITTATGAFLVVIVFGMSDGIRAQSASLGHADEIGRAIVLIAVTVLLVGVVEVAVATTRTVAHRTREPGAALTVCRRTPVVAALLGCGGSRRCWAGRRTLAADRLLLAQSVWRRRSVGRGLDVSARRSRSASYRRVGDQHPANLNAARDRRSVPDRRRLAG
jgi:hypothetical protein